MTLNSHLSNEKASTSSQRAHLRKALRVARKALSVNEQEYAAQAIAEQLSSFIALARPMNVAAYLSNDGEVNLMPYIEHHWQCSEHIQFSLPVLHPVCQGHLLFLEYASQTHMVKNKYGIEEPVLACQQVVPTQQLDIILMPLVGFDKLGNRLGMGGGYYDRTLAFTRKVEQKPMLIGIAHDVQEVDALPIAPWDIPLDAIVTPTQTLVL
ncbi:5-formyltetrahydrofolate cyclo-ligase [Alteromonas sp. KUL42]|nr:5-formyltetrahydrofolate cyclo-ligase [Alteromonas sp. KUL42]TAP38234.1 5-formyltetrahydrofolate cyclo-ligase [Alteromonas sp. KUL42]GEA05464.1 5-formyltetrahydrofolate cyclo-ligase [Alteromonas sp. KUL42]